MSHELSKIVLPEFATETEFNATVEQTQDGLIDPAPPHLLVASGVVIAGIAFISWVSGRIQNRPKRVDRGRTDKV